MQIENITTVEKTNKRNPYESKAMEPFSSDSANKNQNKISASQIYFELTNICNFKCDFCPIQISDRAKDFMDFELFEKTVREISECDISKKISFHVLGEPLLYPRILDAVKFVGDLGLEADLTTNGSLLTREMTNKLVQSGLRHATISLETVDATEHKCRGIGLSHREYYDQILEAVRIFSESGVDVTIPIMNTSSRKYFSLSPDIGVTSRDYVFSDKIQKLIYDVREALGAPVSMKECKDAVRSVNIAKPVKLKISDRVSVYIQMLWDWGNAFSKGKVFEAKKGQCSYMLENIGILNDGTVTLCCGDFEGKTAIGNINKTSLNEMLLSDHVARIRVGKSKNRLTHPHCRRCIGGRNPLEAFLKGWLSIKLFKRLHPLYCQEIDLFS